MLKSRSLARTSAARFARGATGQIGTWPSRRHWTLGRVLLLLLCATVSLLSTPGRSEPAPSSAWILAVNDVYRIEGVDGRTRGGLARLRALRAELEKTRPDLIMLHAGDFLFPSTTSKAFTSKAFPKGLRNGCPAADDLKAPIPGQHMVDLMNRLRPEGAESDDRLIVTFGNHEFEAGSAKALECLIEQSKFRWLGTNLMFRGMTPPKNLQSHALLAADGGKLHIGIFSLTLVSDEASEYVGFVRAIPAARRAVSDLRSKGARVVVALTHQTVHEDEALLRQLCPDGGTPTGTKDSTNTCPDLVIGGHEHERVVRSVRGRLILKADADARTATLVRVTLDTGKPDARPEITHQAIEVGPVVPAPDPRVESRVNEWLAQEDKHYCATKPKPEKPRCLDTSLGRTAVALVGEEHEIRKYETNLGNWIADRALGAFRTEGAQIAFINSGGLRLNQNIRAGTTISERDLQALLPYETSLQLLQIDGRTLQQVVSHAVSDWTGNGRWLQISGFAFRHDQDKGTADALTLLSGGRATPIAPDQTILAVTNTFLAKGGDGYEFLPAVTKRDDARGRPMDLANQLRANLRFADARGGIAPEVEGRICNGRRPGRCRAVAAAAPAAACAPGPCVAALAQAGGITPSGSLAQELAMWSDPVTKIAAALMPLLWFVLAAVAFCFLLDPIKKTIPRLGSLKVAGLEVSMREAREAVSAAVELAEKHRNWPVEVPAADRDAALARAARDRRILDGAEILWVDDRPGNNRNEWRMFRAFGCQITAAASTDEARAAIEISRERFERPFDVVISDMARGETNPDTGMDTLRMVRDDKAGLPVIFYVGRVIVGKDPPAGAFGLTNRPDKLLNLVLDALARRRVLT